MVLTRPLAAALKVPGHQAPNSMKPIVIALPLLLLTACVKPEDPTDVQLPGTCGGEGHRIELSVNGSSWCANASVQAIVSPEGEAIISGIAVSGQFFSLQIDSIAEGSFPINEGANTALWTEEGETYMSVPSDPGALTITDYDADEHHVKGEVSVTLHDPESGLVRGLSGDFDLLLQAQ